VTCSAPARFVAPGATVGIDGACYYPPTQHAGDSTSFSWLPGDEAPASSVDVLHALLSAIGLDVDTLADAGGPVFTDGTLHYRADASNKALREVDAVMAGTGVNGGDFDWATPTAYYEIPVGVILGAVEKADAELTGLLRLTGTLTPTALGADQNNYNPTDLAPERSCGSRRPAARNITGMVPAGGGQTILVVNVGSYDLTLKNANGSSSAPNRFDFDADLVLAAGTGALLWYDITSTRWRKALPAAGGGGSGMTADTGWTAMAGTADKASTFNSETCTFRDLARRVKAIQDTLASNLRPNA
jgi:hypothetical protein